MYSNLFSPDSIAELTVAMQTQFPKAIWETFYVTLLSTALAVVIGLMLVNLFKGSFTPLPSADLGALEYEAKEAPSVMQVIVNIFPSNLLQPMVSSDMLPVIVIAIFLGAGVLAAGEKGQKIAELINCMEEVIMKIMMMIIEFTPYGVFCLMTNVVAENGADIIGKLALIIGVAYLGYIVQSSSFTVFPSSSLPR